MNQTLVVLITFIYALIGFLFFLVLDSEEMGEHVPYGEIPAITSLDNARWMIAIVSCGFWLPALVTGYIAEICQSRKRGRRPYW